MATLVTGAAGFIGSHVSKALLNRGEKVIGLDNFNDFYDPKIKHKNIEQFKNNQNFKLLTLDICNKEKLFKALNEHKLDCIVHLAALGNVRRSVQEPLNYLNVNIIGTANLLEFVREFGPKQFIFASTSSVYGNNNQVPFKEIDNTDHPLAAYPMSKKSSELMGHAYSNLHNLNFTALRFFNVYGPSGRPDMMPYKIAEALVNDTEISLYDQGTLKRDWTYIDDIVSGVLGTKDLNCRYEIFNLGRGEPFDMLEFVEIMQNLAGKKLKVKFIPAPKTEPKQTFASVEKANKMFDYNPRTSLQEGLKSFWEWYKNFR